LWTLDLGVCVWCSTRVLFTNGEFHCCFFHFMLPWSQVRVHNHVNRPPLLGGGHADCRFCKMRINAGQGRTALEVCYRYRLSSLGIMATGFFIWIVHLNLNSAWLLCSA
jgi:hypothetical protein